MALTSIITLGGNLTADPELRQGQNGGKSFVRVSVAVNNRTFNRETKEWEDGEPVFWRGVAFGELAEHIAASLSKGNRVIMHGTVKADNWIDKDSGVKRTEKTLQIEDMGPSLQFMNATPTKASAPAPSQGADEWANPGAWSEDMPF